MAVPSFALLYDQLVFDPFLREYFGPAGYFNAGFWLPHIQSQEQASRELTDRVIDLLPEEAGAILDVGCGLGAATARLAHRRPHSLILAANISWRQLAACRLRCPSLRLIQMDAARVALAENCIDAVFSVEAAFHFCTRAGFLREALRILKPGGALALSDIVFKTRDWPGAWTIPAGNTLEGREGYCELLQSTGFENVHIEDVTAATWNGFTRHLEVWLREKGEAASDAGQHPELLVPGLAGAVSNYLLVSAVKPPGNKL